MKPLPLPVRIAAGLVATAVEQARELPRLVVEFPVTAVSQALQASMRVQQKVTALAIKGDRVLCALRPVPDAPSWATFDDDRPTSNGAAAPPQVRQAESPQRPREEPDTTVADVAATATQRAAAGDTAGGSTTPGGSADGAGKTQDTGGVGDAGGPDEAGRTDDTAGPDDTAGADDIGGADTGGPDDLGGPNVLPGYAEMTMSQLRARLRRLTLDDLRALLAWEQAHANRPPFVTMLGNRITTVTQG